MRALFDPAEIERRIDESLSRSGETVKRASLLTLVAVHRHELQATVAERLEYLFGRRPLRVIRIETGHDAPTSVDVSARCLPRSAGDEVCFQEIVIYSGPDNLGLDSALWAPLVIRDLPLVVLWLEGADELATALERTHIQPDKCLVDSAALGLGAIARLYGRLRRKPGAPALADLSWRALTDGRVKIARLFDGALPLLERLARVEFYGWTENDARLLSLWLAGRLGWKKGKVTGDGLSFTDARGGSVAVRLDEARQKRFGVSFITRSNEKLGLEQADAHSVHLNAGGREWTEPYDAACGGDCLLAELDRLSPDPVYDEVLQAALDLEEGARA